MVYLTLAGFASRMAVGGKPFGGLLIGWFVLSRFVADFRLLAQESCRFCTPASGVR